MTPVYVSAIYFCIPSLVRPPLNTSIGCFRLALFGMLFVDWLIFRHGVFPAVKSNRVENAPCDVTKEILLNIIHTHQIKIRQKKLRNLFTPSAIFFATKFHVLSSCLKLPAKYFHHINETEPFSVFVNGTVLTVLYQTYCGYDGTERGFTKCDLIVTKRTKLLFSLSEQ